MTKYLVRIISIFTFIVLIPVVIAGVALSAVGSTMYKLKVYIAGDTNTAAACEISVTEKGKDSIVIKKGENNEFSFQNDTDVTVVADIDGEGKNGKTLEGYDFVGWFNGDDKTYVDSAEPVSSDLSHTFPLKSDVQLTAVVKSKQYNITFDGYYDDDETRLEAELFPERKGVLFGEEIVSESDKPKPISGSNFIGWRIKDSGGAATNVAKFPQSGDITLEPVWSDRVTINYYLEGEDTPFIGKPYTQDTVSSFELMNYSNPADKKIIDDKIGEGYAFAGFATEGGVEINAGNVDELVKNVISSDFDNYKDKEFKIIVKRSLVNYTVKITSEMGDKKSYNLTYNIDKKFGNDVMNTLKENITRKYYEIAGLKIGGESEPYTFKDNDFVNASGKSLSEKLLALEGTTELDAQIVWKVEDRFSSITIDYASSALNGTKSVYYKSGDQLVKVARSIDVYEIDDGDGYKLEDYLINIVYGDTLNGKEFVVSLGDGSQKTVVLNTIKVWYNYSEFVPVPVESPVSLATAIEWILQYQSSYRFGDGIRIQFCYEEANA